MRDLINDLRAIGLTVLTEDDLPKPHAKRRENDEYFCRRCGKRWAIDEEEPPCQ